MMRNMRNENGKNDIKIHRGKLYISCTRKLHGVTSKPSKLTIQIYPVHIENLIPQESSLAKLQHSIIFLRCDQCLPKPCKFLRSQRLDSFTGSFPQRVHHTQWTMTPLLMLWRTIPHELHPTCPEGSSSSKTKNNLRTTSCIPASDFWYQWLD